MDELALEVLAKGHTQAGRARVERFQTLTQQLFGTADPPGSPPLAPITDFPALRMSARHRADVEATAKATVEAWGALELEKLGEHLAPQVFCLWGQGTLARHDSDDLLAALAERKGEAVWLVPERVRTYPWAELRSHLPPSVSIALDECLGLSNVMICAMDATSTKLNVGRLMVTVHKGRGGQWRAQTLPLPAIDTAIVESRKASLAEEDHVRFADKIVRPFMVANATMLRSLRNHMMNLLYLNGQMEVPEKIIEKLERRGAPAERIDLCYLGTRSEPFDRLDVLLDARLQKSLERDAPKIWRRKVEQLRPRLAVTRIGSLHPETQKPIESGQIVSMMFRQLEVDQARTEREHWRLAGLWIMEAEASPPG